MKFPDLATELLKSEVVTVWVNLVHLYGRNTRIMLGGLGYDPLFYTSTQIKLGELGYDLSLTRPILTQSAYLPPLES